MSARATLSNNTTVKGDGCGRLSLEQRKIILKLYSTSEAVYKQTESPNWQNDVENTDLVRFAAVF